MPKIVPNRTQNPFPNVPVPGGAVKVDDWVDLSTPTPFRYFQGSKWVVDRPNCDEGIDVYLAGIQRPDGRVEREIAIHQLRGDDVVTVEEARRLAAALTAAADEMVQMAGDRIEPADELDGRLDA